MDISNLSTIIKKIVARINYVERTLGISNQNVEGGYYGSDGKF
jgi:hypothetical protein